MAQASQGSEIGLGSVLGGTYQVAGLLGKGGMGAVYAATHTRLPGKKFAIKVLHAGAISAEAYARFRREAEIASRIGHPNIIEVIDWNTLPDGTPYLVLEFLAGEPLSKRLERGPMPLDPALALVRQIGSALAAAHRAGIVHRDLKPDNIFLCPTDSGGQVTDHVKVLDFGISKIKNSTTVQTQEAQLLGTPQYMAPEQASGKNREVDQRTDVFALGAIVYEMLSGRAAFAGENLAQVVYRVVFEEPTPLAEIVPGLPPAVVRALERALAKDPAARFPDVQTFVQELTGRPLFTLDKVDAQPALAFDPTVHASGSLALGATAAVAAGTGQRPMAAGSMPATPLVTAPPPLTPAPPPPQSTKTGRRVGLVMGVVAVVAGLGAAAVVATRQKAPSEPAPPPVAKPPEPKSPVAIVGDQTKPPVVLTVKPPAPPEPPSVPTPLVPDRTEPKPVVVTPAPPEPPPAPRPPVPGRTEPKPPVAVKPAPRPEPPKPAEPEPQPRPLVPAPPPRPLEPEEPASPTAVAAELGDADKALRAGAYDEAIRLARRSLTTMRTERAYMIITAGFCGKRDLSNAKANLLNAHGRARFNALRTCRKLDFPLE